MKDKEDDPSPLHVTLFQEVERYNVLLENMLSTLKLLKGSTTLYKRQPQTAAVLASGFFVRRLRT